MPKGQSVTIQKFNGLWVRDTIDSTPPDHFSDCLNTIYGQSGVGMRDGLSSYLGIANVVYMALYKPNPPFTGTNVPRIIALNNIGQLFDALKSTTVPIYTNVLMKSFGFVNFFGRCYISPSDGKVGLAGVNVKVYDGTTFRDAGGARPTTPLTGVLSTTPGNIGVGTVLVSYAFETSTGFITQPATPFIYIDSFGTGTIDITLLPLGPSGTAARWIICTKVIPLRANLGIPPNVAEAEVLPLFFAARIGNNIDTTYSLTFFDEQLINDAAYLLSQLTVIPAGVGLLDYKGRMLSYGAAADPSLPRVSEPGEPEAFSATSGFLITDPSDNTGVRAAIEFRNSLYLFKLNRGYLTEDNGEEASTWQLINFEKAVGTENNGIADILDAKGASSEGFLIASRGALYYFNGVMSEPELSYKIRDLWLTISEEYFYLTQVVNDPINKRIYILVALDDATSISHIIYGDYRNGMSSTSIKWSLWKFVNNPTSMLAYTDFTDDKPTLVTRISQSGGIKTLNIDIPSNDDGVAVDSNFTLAPIRFSEGVSHFDRVRFDAGGPGTLVLTAYGKNKQNSVTPAPLVIASANPDREYAQLMNLVSEQCEFKVQCAVLNEKYSIMGISIEGGEYADERPR